jgi:predicted TIM-barrel fold metal-dependent hydrolase
MKFTPYPTEDVGWLVREAGPDVLLFNSDYPHVEGGRRPIERFERSLGDASDEVRQAFYCDNFLEMMGSAARHLASV